MRFVSLILLFCAAQLAFAGADYTREKKWADEVSPGLVVGEAHYLKAKDHSFLAIETDAANAKAGVVIVHGIGIHPDWGLIGVLRQQLADQGYTTLSIQMPILAVDATAEQYEPLMAESAERIRVAVKALQDKGYKKIALVSHSMGSRMSQAYFKANPDTPVNAWVAIGMGSKESLAVAKVPVLDLYGERDLPNVVKNAPQRAAQIKANPKSQQIKAPKADHFFADQDAELVKYVKTYLDKTL